ncbi:MAG: hypothetical protein A3A16_02360 [Candidatus Harrisonbacteria bacterium RIFCSPLOWO2_01_FULL_44_18]|uniref:Uncharacterized protein n=1 Tax=Candidatus Harrisonbacteria bacterium RIFCSPLOWO2_01_FULL_44_18 TaxID=1798407 RepID=A0A1G1ZNH6_9BACT|nr:MAG: hypothetical protein A3A16_02360 [Candidatus Harrisonbacteria bacterium RIFCSPLOWO2_01_FULL_44_18]
MFAVLDLRATNFLLKGKQKFSVVLCSERAGWRVRPLFLLAGKAWRGRGGGNALPARRKAMAEVVSIFVWF